MEANYIYVCIVIPSYDDYFLSVNMRACATCIGVWVCVCWQRCG